MGIIPDVLLVAIVSGIVIYFFIVHRRLSRIVRNFKKNMEERSHDTFSPG